MSEIEKYILVYIAGITGIWKGIPVGIGLSLNPVFIGLFTAFGSITSVLILYFAGESFRQWVLKLYGEKRIERKKGKFLQFTNRYGPWGLGFVTAGLLGPFTSVILGLILISNSRRFLLILMFGILFWSIVLAYIFSPLFEIITRMIGFH